MKQRLIVFAGAAAFVGLSVVGGELGELALPQAGGLTAYSMLTQDGQRLVVRVEPGREEHAALRHARPGRVEGLLLRRALRREAAPPRPRRILYPYI